MKIGRNDPCPCGSGKKFKKCCIDKPEYRQSAAGTATPTLSRSTSASTKNSVSLNSLLTKAKPAVTQQDLDMLFRAVQGAKHERIDGIDKQIGQLQELSTGDILAKLRDAGAPIDENSFAESARQLHSPLLLSETWTGDPWAPFAFVAAADVLWDRWCPDMFRWDKFNHLMMQGYAVLQQRVDSSLEACVVWQNAWEMLRDFAKSEEIDNIDFMMEKWRRHLMEDPFNWAQDFEVELQNACLDDLSWAPILLTYTREFQDFFAKSDTSILYNMRLTEGDALFLLDEPEAGDAHFEAMIMADPANAWPYVRWGDNYVPGPLRRKTSFADLRKAHEILNRGLKDATRDRDAIEERLRDWKR